ncbi:MAG: 3'-5' exonuclease domain-containing protein 2, partial [Candidatus Marinimicrobia bacterium]|nr:3'-5' exonuclease domain-containing protein 2 [Candidatus Neomarinimicrobiota bacterium]
MNKTAPNLRLTKEEINELPLEYFSGSIHVLESKKDVNNACARLQNESILGFDTETRPAFKKGQFFLPSLLQLAGLDTVYLFRINKCGLPGSLKSLLANHTIVKTGVAIDRDIKDMQKISDFTPGSFVD